MEKTPDFLVARRCMREPVKEIFLAAQLLDRAVDAHLAGDRIGARDLIIAANLPEVRAWTESLWGSRKANPDQWRYVRYRSIADAPPVLPKDARIKVRMPSSAEKQELIKLHGRNCVFCGIPLIRAEVRSKFALLYPELALWGSSNINQHAAFQCMWLQYDHLVPHSRGGDNSIENIIITCSACNYGRMHWTIEELGLLDPRSIARESSSWDGLERII